MTTAEELTIRYQMSDLSESSRKLRSDMEDLRKQQAAINRAVRYLKTIAHYGHRFKQLTTELERNSK